MLRAFMPSGKYVLLYILGKPEIVDVCLLDKIILGNFLLTIVPFTTIRLHRPIVNILSVSYVSTNST